MNKEADVLRGNALRKLYSEKKKYEDLEPTNYEDLTETKQDKVDKSALIRYEADKSKSVEQHKQDVLKDWAIETSISEDVSEINTAAKYVARYNWIKENNKIEEANKAWVDVDKYNKYSNRIAVEGDE